MLWVMVNHRPAQSRWVLPKRRESVPHLDIHARVAYCSCLWYWCVWRRCTAWLWGHETGSTECCTHSSRPLWVRRVRGICPVWMPYILRDMAPGILRLHTRGLDQRKDEQESSWGCSIYVAEEGCRPSSRRTDGWTGRWEWSVSEVSQREPELEPCLRGINRAIPPRALDKDSSSSVTIFSEVKMGEEIY
jgi:hypothetical protein